MTNRPRYVSSVDTDMEEWRQNGDSRGKWQKRVVGRNNAIIPVNRSVQKQRSGRVSQTATRRGKEDARSEAENRSRASFFPFVRYNEPRERVALSP